jgi:hypothetical protein
VRYLMLLNNTSENVRHWETLSPEEAAKLRQEEIPKWGTLFAWLGEKGIEPDGLELDGPGQTKTVRVRNGDVLVTDGPHAETKEQIGGYFVVDLPDLDEAIEVASRIPVVEKGSVEIRPLVEM